MHCVVTEEQLWSWVDRAAPELDEHVRGCEPCRERAAALRQAIENVAIGALPNAAPLPASIGPYSVTRLLGEGGQGVVYEARRADDGRPVAIKLLKHGATGRNGRLFARETASLERLRHPSIAAIHESGRTPAGQPYLVMEYVEGRPLHVYLRDADPRLRDKLELFVRICEPISYAHRHGVIHRDLKPSNILVVDHREQGTGNREQGTGNREQGTGNREQERPGHSPVPCSLIPVPSPQPKILDFGLARISDADLTLTFTLDGGNRVNGTLPYMSPEQASGEPGEADARSDVYALGVMLYEMTTGRLPHEMTRAAPYEMLRAIREDVPPRPSSFNRALRGDLETIILKALDKEPARRYASVDALADDVARYLAGQPIAARPPGAHDQLRRVLVRHKTAAAFTAALFVLISAFAVTAAIQAARVATERDRALDSQRRLASARASAVEEAARAARTARFMEELLFAADPRWTSGEMTVRELLAQAQQRLDAERFDDPLLEAELRAIVARTYRRFGIPLHGSLDAGAAARRLDESAGVDPLKRADALTDLSACAADAADAVPMLERALAIRERLLGAEHDDVAATRLTLAEMCAEAGDHVKAERQQRAVLASRQARFGDEHALVAAAWLGLGDCLAAQKRFGEGEKAIQAALRIRLRLMSADDPDVGRALHRLASLHHKAGDADAARRVYAAALDVFRRHCDQAPNVVHVLQNLAQLEQDTGRPEEAAALLDDAVSLARASFPTWHYISICCQRQFGEVLYELGRYGEARANYVRSLAGVRELLADDDPFVLRVQAALKRVEAVMARRMPAAGDAIHVTQARATQGSAALDERP